jgi:NADH:ubiquinone reductase (H+-translocating)
VATVIARRVAGRPARGPFRYRDLGTLAVIGRSRAVADLGRVQLRGLPAWLFWSLVHSFCWPDFATGSWFT